MQPISALIAVIVAIVAGVAAAAEPPMVATISTVPDIEAYRRDHPELTVTPLAVATRDAGTARQQIVYSLGVHTAGERLVAVSSDGQTWTASQDVTLNLRYPTAGTGALITYIEVVVNQSSNQGRGYVVSGGTGSRSVHVVIEAYRTLYFNYSAAIYGL